MKRLPDRPSLDHLKKQAKQLLRLYKSRDAEALGQFREALPAAAGKSDAEIIALDLRLHDAQSCVAREYGFQSWADLKTFAEGLAAPRDDRTSRRLQWLRIVYSGHIAGGNGRSRPILGARLLAEDPDLVEEDVYLACAIGDENALRRTTKTDPEWVNRAGGPLKLPPLVAVTHSSLLQLPVFRERLHASAHRLLDAGADPNQSVGNRFPPASLQQPSDEFKLSALYGAAGENHDPELTKLLLDAGADPNDNESLYHSVEGNLACTRLLLEAGARIKGSNALYRVLDFDKVDVLRLLLAYGGDPNEPPMGSPTSDWGCPLLWAIRRRRSAAHIGALLEAGADPRSKTPNAVSAYRLALQFGLVEVARQLERAGGADSLTTEEEFIAACTRCDETEARRLQAIRPDLPGSLSEAQLRLLPELAAEGGGDAVQLMVKLSWPIEVRGGDWNASALNLAVFRGDPALTRFLLEHGASWREEHGHGDNACGTLSWASRNEPIEGGDWLGCAEALVAFGMPGAELDPQEPGSVLIDGHRKHFSDEVTDFLLRVRGAR
jgi:hypothetical protein